MRTVSWANLAQCISQVSPRRATGRIARRQKLWQVRGIFHCATDGAEPITNFWVQIFWSCGDRFPFDQSLVTYKMGLFFGGFIFLFVCLVLFGFLWVWFWFNWNNPSVRTKGFCHCFFHSGAERQGTKPYRGSSSKARNIHIPLYKIEATSSTWSYLIKIGVVFRSAREKVDSAGAQSLYNSQSLHVDANVLTWLTIFNIWV